MEPSVESLQSELAWANATKSLALIGAAVFAGIALWQWSGKSTAVTRAERDTLREALGSRRPAAPPPPAPRLSGAYGY